MVLGLLAISVASPAQAQSPDASVGIHFFTREGCQHCADARAFLNSIQADSPSLRVIEYDIGQTTNQELWQEVVRATGASQSTPLLLIGDTALQGFDSELTTGRVIVELLESSELTTVADFLNQENSRRRHIATDGQCDETCELDPSELSGYGVGQYVRIPYTSRVIDIGQYSLPLMAGILGLIDGFNPCAMWVLVSFLVILLQVGDRRKMLLFAGVFILAETVMYFLILNLWFTTWDFVGLDQVVTPIIGLLASGAGVYFLYKAWQYDGTCTVTDIDTRQKTRSRIQELATQPFTLLTFFGILGVAFSVNVIEFACSIGIPQTFTKILELQGFGIVEALPYTLLYIAMYMVDDFLVFGVALYGADKLGMTTKYTRVTQILGGVIMLLLGGILLLRPDLLASL